MGKILNRPDRNFRRLLDGVYRNLYILTPRPFNQKAKYTRPEEPECRATFETEVSNHVMPNSYHRDGIFNPQAKAIKYDT